jgi:membrane protease YdiL (CAAX protease family)
VTATCPRCGSPITGRFCGGCGHFVGDQSAANAVSVAPGASARRDALYGVTSPAALVATPHDRKMLSWETRFVMFAFLLPAIAGAVIVLAEHASGVGSTTRFPTFVAHRPEINLVLGIFSYLTVAAVVPLALLLLMRTGQPPRYFRLGMPSITKDVVPGLGLAAASYGVATVLGIFLILLVGKNSPLLNNVANGHVPWYFVFWGLAISLTTAIAEEVMMCGYFLTRLEQLGWSPGASFALSLALRTSYHVYYGIGFLLTIPLGYFVTRSFQKHGRLGRTIAAHFLYDAVVFTFTILH